ncbi:hypothetical protein [Campylobacter rectus]|uniref:hypothetical protein n=1 Tax=Campylobacter rectus TaxID=203 RepID=UPI0028E5804A|nr:hypothetical protein [Campylobacter rectus]
MIIFVRCCTDPDYAVKKTSCTLANCDKFNAKALLNFIFICFCSNFYPNFIKNPKRISLIAKHFKLKGRNEKFSFR